MPKGLGSLQSKYRYLCSITLMSGLLLQYPAGWLSDRFDRRKVIFSVTFIVATISTLMSISTSFPLLYLFIIMSILSGFSTTLFPLCMAYANDYVDANEMLKTARRTQPGMGNWGRNWTAFCRYGDAVVWSGWTFYPWCRSGNPLFLAISSGE